jgi:hypothetical protein
VAGKGKKEKREGGDKPQSQVTQHELISRQAPMNDAVWGDAVRFKIIHRVFLLLRTAFFTWVELFCIV